MSKRIFVTMQNRRPGDSPRLIKAIVEACPPDAHLELYIECQSAISAKSRQARIDEQTETKVSRQVGGELDELEKLARAVEEHDAEKAMADLDSIARKAEATVERRRNIVQWFEETARAAWSATVKATVEAILKNDDSQ